MEKETALQDEREQYFCSCDGKVQQRLGPFSPTLSTSLRKLPMSVSNDLGSALLWLTLDGSLLVEPIAYCLVPDDWVWAVIS